MGYIDADRLNADLDKWVEAMADAEGDYSDGVRFAIQHFIFLLASLQQEQPELPGIEESGVPGKDYIPVEWVDACEKYGKWKIVKQEQPEEVDLAEEIVSFFNKHPLRRLTDWPLMKNVALHFYELGRNARKL